MCGDGLTVNLLYQIKDEYGESMKWLFIMLGTWHTLKDYLRIFMQKYRYAFIQPVLEQSFSANTLGGIIGVSQWEKSHRYGLYIFEALLRLLVEYLKKEGIVPFPDLKAQLLQLIEILKHPGLSELQVKKYSLQRERIFNTLYDSMSSLNHVISVCVGNDEVFAFFENTIDDFVVYMMLYISIRSGNWSLRITR